MPRLALTKISLPSLTFSILTSHFKEKENYAITQQVSQRQHVQLLQQTLASMREWRHCDFKINSRPALLDEF